MALTDLMANTTSEVLIEENNVIYIYTSHSSQVGRSEQLTALLLTEAEEDTQHGADRSNG